VLGSVWRTDANQYKSTTFSSVHELTCKFTKFAKSSSMNSS